MPSAKLQAAANSLLVARELAPAGLRSRPIFRAAARPSGSRLPRHRLLRSRRVPGPSRSR
ncbi:hypothetical protein DCC84_20890 [Pseudomonas sp. SXM-1]|nr:hypothetical protein DCC84_20890 [Pseudomonas sp. SXM-1]